MRFSEVFAASLLAPLIAAHGGLPGAPKIVGLPVEDAASLKTRNVRYPARAPQSPHGHGSQLQARQGGVDGRCGPSFGCATCAEGYCCSSGAWCGQGMDYCQAPDSLFEYGPAADANVLPPGGSTRNTARTKSGSVLYGGEGIWVCTKPGQVAITYDDGPYQYTNKVLDLFASYNFKATFFVTGINLYKGRIDDEAQPWPAMIRRMASEGHQLASHTWSHQDLSAITKDQRYEQMIRLEMALTNIMGKFPTYMRPPYSSCTAASGCEQDMADLGYHTSYFDLDTDDYNNITPELQQNAKDRVFQALNPSNSASDEFLAIAHDIHYQTAYNLTGYMLDLMVKKGYTGVTMGECLGDAEANWYRTPSSRTATSSAFKAPACASTASSSRSASASASASATTSGPTSTPTAVSTDGSCGSASGFTCSGFADGECCSQYNYCGSSEGHCGTGCQAGFGKCGLSSSSSLASSVAQSSSATSSRAASSSTMGLSSSVRLSSAQSSSIRASSTVASSVRVSSASAAPSSTPSRAVSQDGSCGGTNGYTCVGFSEGECCSQYGWCGNMDGHCGSGCNPLFGKCTSSGSSSSAAPASSSVRPASSSVRPASSSVRPASSSVRPASSSIRPVSSSARPASSTARSSSSSRISSTSTAKPTGVVSPDGSCGSTKGYICTGSSAGSCCSQYGWCGNTSGHCGTGCNKLYGTCT